MEWSWDLEMDWKRKLKSVFFSNNNSCNIQTMIKTICSFLRNRLPTAKLFLPFSQLKFTNPPTPQLNPIPDEEILQQQQEQSLELPPKVKPVQSSFLKMLIQQFNSEAGELTLSQQMESLTEILSILRGNMQPILHDQFDCLFNLRLKLKLLQMQTLDIIQLSKLIEFYVLLKRMDIFKSSINMQSELYRTYSLLLTAEEELPLPLYKVAEIQLLFAELTHINPNEIIRTYEYLNNRVFAEFFQGIELDTMLTFMTALYKQSKKTQPQRTLLARMLINLQSGYSLLNNKDKLRLVFFILRYDIERQYSVYVHGQVRIIQKFIEDLSKQTLNLNDSQIYRVLLPKYQYQSWKQRKQVEDLLINYFFDNINLDNDGKTVFSVKMALDIMFSCSKGRRFKQFTPLQQHKIIAFYQYAINLHHQLHFYMKIMINISNLIFVDFFQDSLPELQQLKAAIGMRRMSIKLIYEFTRMGIRIEPFHFEIQENRYTKRKLLIECNKNAIRHEINLLLSYKRQEQYHPNDAYFASLAKMKYNDFLQLFQHNIPTFIHALASLHTNVLAQFGSQFDFANFMVSLPLQTISFTTNLKRKLLYILMHSSYNQNLMIQGKPFCFFVGSYQFYRILINDKRLYSKMNISPLVLRTMIHHMHLIFASKKQKQYRTLLQSMFQPMITYTDILSKSMKGRAHSIEFQSYWEVLDVMVTYYHQIKVLQSEFFKLKFLFRQVLEVSMSFFSSCIEMSWFLEKSLDALLLDEDVNFLTKKVVTRAIYLKIINRDNFKSFLEKAKSKEVLTIQTEVLAACFQNKQVSKTSKSFVFQALKHNSNIKPETEKQIYRFFKTCQKNNLFIKILSLFDLAVNPTNSQLYFYILKQFTRAYESNPNSKKYNLISILQNIAKYKPGLSEDSSAFDFVLPWLQSVLQYYEAQYEEIPLNYLTYDIGSKCASLQAKLSESLFKPYQTITGSKAIVQLLIKKEHQFTTPQWRLIDELLIGQANKKVLNGWSAKSMMHYKKFEFFSTFFEVQANPYQFYSQIIEAIHSSIVAKQHQQASQKQCFWSSQQHFCIWLTDNSIWVVTNDESEVNKTVLTSKLHKIMMEKTQLKASQWKITKQDSLDKEQLTKKLNLDRAMSQKCEDVLNQIHELLIIQPIGQDLDRYSFTNKSPSKHPIKDEQAQSEQ